MPAPILTADGGNPIGKVNVTNINSLGTINTPASGSISASHKVAGLTVFTTLTLTNVPQTVFNGVEHGGVKLYTFPPVRMTVQNVKVNLQQKTTSDLATTLNASSTGAVSLGSTASASTTLNSTAANFLPSTAFTSSATINVAGALISAMLDSNYDAAEFFVLDGQDTPIALYLNSAYATTTDVDADATQTWSGTIDIVYTAVGWKAAVGA